SWAGPLSALHAARSFILTRRTRLRIVPPACGPSWLLGPTGYRARESLRRPPASRQWAGPPRFEWRWADVNRTRGVQEEASMKGLKGVIVGLAGLGLMLVPAQSHALFDGFNRNVCAPPCQPNPCINNNVWHGQEVSDPAV